MDEKIRNTILEKSEELFAHYGFNKTTMAEIARECTMSPANLYRYFENKEEIGVSIAKGCMGKCSSALREVINKPGLTASQTLEEMVLTEIRHNTERFANTPRLMELVEFIGQQRHDVVDEHINLKRSLIAEVLSRGNASGEFDVEDVIETADTIKVATMRFWLVHMYLMFNDMCTEDIEAKAKQVVALLVKGLLKR